jgi:hypothetical protein
VGYTLPNGLWLMLQAHVRNLVKDLRRTPPSLAGGVVKEPAGPEVETLSTERLIAIRDNKDNGMAARVMAGELLMARSALTPSPVPTTIPAETSGTEGALEKAARMRGVEAAIAALPGERDPSPRSLDDEAGPNNPVWDKGWNAFREKAIRRIRALTAVPEEGNRGWQDASKVIPALLRDDEADRRPNYVLVFNGYHVGTGYRQVPNYEGDPEWCDETGAFIEPPVTHWMPLPAAPARTGKE